MLIIPEATFKLWNNNYSSRGLNKCSYKSIHHGFVTGLAHPWVHQGEITGDLNFNSIFGGIRFLIFLGFAVLIAYTLTPEGVVFPTAGRIRILYNRNSDPVILFPTLVSTRMGASRAL